MLKLFAKLAMFLPFVALVALVNYRVDPSGLFWGRGFERSAAEYMLRGEYIDGYERLDGRALDEVYAKNAEQAPDILINGSSRSMQIDSSFARPGLTLFNAGNVGADIYDFFNSFYYFEKEDKAPKIMVLSVDPWIFNDGPESKDRRSDPEMYNEFISLELGLGDSDYERQNPGEKYLALISPSYFQASVRYYFRDKSADVSPQTVPSDLIYDQDEVIKCPDGSIIYDRKYREKSTERSDREALIASDNDLLYMADFTEVSPVYKQQVEKFVEYMQSKGIKVIFFLPPFHRIIYDTAVEKYDKYHCIFEVEEYIKSLGEKYGAEVYGSYSPYELGLENGDFMDGYHLKQDSIRKILPLIG